MNHVLILTCSTGEGHNSAAHALQSALFAAGIASEVADPVSFQSERMQHAVASLYNNMIKKTPAVFGAIYKLGDLYSSTNLPSPVYWANAQYAQALQKFIITKAFDAVICTHLYGMEVMTAIREKGQLHIPCYGVLTDYVCIPFIEETHMDLYFVSCDRARQDLIDKGIPARKIVVSGIPVHERFVNHPSKSASRMQLHIPPEKKIFLVMTGGVGCENMIGLCNELVKHLKNDAEVYVLTGKNQNLKQRLDSKYGLEPRFHTVPFTRQVATYMAAADVLLSKPGGLSSTEAAVANIPLVHIHAIPGCETYNARFFSENGMSMHASNDKQAVIYAQQLAYDKETADLMVQAQQRYIPNHAAATIIEEMMHK